MSTFPTVRAGYGTFLLVAPDVAGRLALGRPTDARLRLVIRIVGARHVAQAVLTTCAPGTATLAAGAGVDLAHMATMIGLAATDRRRRRAALIGAADACSFALAGIILAARRASAGGTNRNGNDH